MKTKQLKKQCAKGSECKSSNCPFRHPQQESLRELKEKEARRKRTKEAEKATYEFIKREDAKFEFEFAYDEPTVSRAQQDSIDIALIPLNRPDPKARSTIGLNMSRKPPKSRTRMDDEAKICVRCKRKFKLTTKSKEFFVQHGLSLPKRCRECRDSNQTNRREDVAFGIDNIKKGPAFANNEHYDSERFTF